MSKLGPFTWRHLESEIILLCVRWYLRYSLSYRDLARDDAGTWVARGPHDDLSLSCSALPLNWTDGADLI